MLHKENDNVQWLEFELFQSFPKLKHGVFLRHGGVSEGPFSSLNVGLLVGDSENNVLSNHQKIKQTLSLKNLAFAKQCHGTTLSEVTAQNLHLHRECDGLVTNTPEIGLMIMHADCQAAIFYDPVNHAAANIHSGWKGSVQNIYSETVHLMHKMYGSKAADLHVAISPSLGPENSEFIHYKKELPENFWDFQVKPNYFDFWEISLSQLTQCGVLPGHMQFAKICTYENSRDYFSYRRENITGRHGTVLTLL